MGTEPLWKVCPLHFKKNEIDLGCVEMEACGCLNYFIVKMGFKVLVIGASFFTLKEFLQAIQQGRNVRIGFPLKI